MTTINSKSILQSITIGIIAGMRSAMAPAVASHILNRDRSERIGESPVKFIQSDGFATTMKVFSVGELIIDKLPATGNRIEPAGIAARFVSGSVSAAILSGGNKKKLIISTLIGSAAAVASAYGCYYLRKGLGKCTSIPDFVLGTIEDSLALGAGVALIKTT